MGSEMCIRDRGFTHWMKTKTPRVTVKLAASMDGRIAARGGESKWISSADSRRRVHEMRARSDAILVGAGTVLADDPLLTVRDADGADPLRVVLDSRLEIPPDSRVVKGEAASCLPRPANRKLRERVDLWRPRAPKLSICRAMNAVSRCGGLC